MKSLLSALVTVIFINSFVFSQSSDWSTVKDLESGYRVDFPGEAEKKSSEVSTEKGPLDMYTYSYLDVGGDSSISFMTSYTRYPTEFFPNGLESIEAQRAFFEGSVNGAVANLNGKLISNESFEFNGYPGRHIKIEVVSQGFRYVMIMWSVLVDYEFYILQAIGEEDYSDNKNVKRFINSFELIKTKGN